MYTGEIRATERLFQLGVANPAFLVANAAGVAEILYLLDRLHVIMILIGRVVAQDVHVESSALFDHRQTDSPRADDRNCLASDFIAQKRQIRMPETPLVSPGQMLRTPKSSSQCPHHKKCELCGCFCVNVGCVREWNAIAVGVRAVDIVEADRVLSNDFECAFPRLKQLGVDLVTKCRDQAVDPCFQFCDDQALRWGFGLLVNFDLIAALTQRLDRLSDVAGGKHTKVAGHVLSGWPRAEPSPSYQRRKRIDSLLQRGRAMGPSGRGARLDALTRSTASPLV